MKIVNEKKEVSAVASGISIVSFYIFWFLIGGFFTWGPLISHGVNEGLVLLAIALWGLIFITSIGPITRHPNSESSIFNINIFAWICAEIAVFYNIGW